MKKIQKLSFEIYETGLELYQSQYARYLRTLDEVKLTHPKIYVFMCKITEWARNRDKSLLHYTVFHKVFPGGELDFFGNLNSFVSNCLLDDSYFRIDWYRYKLETKTIEAPKTSRSNEYQTYEYTDRVTDEHGNYVTEESDKNDSRAWAEVSLAYDPDPRATQKVELLLEAMEIMEEREKQRKEQAELVLHMIHQGKGAGI